MMLVRVSLAKTMSRFSVERTKRIRTKATERKSILQPAVKSPKDMKIQALFKTTREKSPKTEEGIPAVQNL